MNHKEAFILIVICACIVFFERSLPWIAFEKKEMPKIVKRLSDLLPASLGLFLIFLRVTAVLLWMSWGKNCINNCNNIQKIG